MTPAINQYLTKRYQGLMDYAVYHCTRAGIQDEASDVLDEVILSLLQKDEQYLLRLLETPSKCGKYMEIDILILRMIYLNCYSETAPYRAKYKPIPSADVDFRRLNIESVEDLHEDTPAMMFEKFQQVRNAYEYLQLSPKAKDIFEWKWEHGESFSRWPGPETQKELYDVYNHVLEMIKDKIFNRTLL